MKSILQATPTLLPSDHRTHRLWEALLAALTPYVFAALALFAYHEQFWN